VADIFLTNYVAMPDWPVEAPMRFLERLCMAVTAEEPVPPERLLVYQALAALLKHNPELIDAVADPASFGQPDWAIAPSPPRPRCMGSA